MRTVCIAWLLAAAALPAQQPGNQEPVSNVNSRYIVESVEVPDSYLSKLSLALRDRIHSLAGSQFDQHIFDEITRRIADELKNRIVVMKLVKGSQPEQVRVMLEISEKGRDRELVVSRLVYHSRQNFTFGSDVHWNNAEHDLYAGILTDNDELVERYSGIRGGYERSRLAGGHLAFGIAAATYRSQWNPAVEESLKSATDVPGIYRTRVHFQPSSTLTILEPLTLQLGVSFERLEMQYPAARHELSSAAFATLRYQRRWELNGGTSHGLDASYGIRSAGNSLNSDFVFTRHHWEAGYRYKRNRDEVRVGFEAGLLNGRAPLMERFTLGNSRTLRGWNRFDVDPLGGDRMAHASLEYRYRPLRFIYDTGSAWRRGASSVLRHSFAFGLARKTLGFTALIAFPLRSGPIEPIFMTGINF